MISADRRYCDTCNVQILDHEPYYTGIAPKGTAEDVAAANPNNAPSFTPLADRRVKLELCERCTGEAPDLLEAWQLERVE